MVEGERQAPVSGIEDDGRAGIVGAPRDALGPGQEDRRDGVKAGVPGRVRIRPQLAEELDLERSFLARLPDGGRLERLAVVDETPGKGPAGRGVLALDEDDAELPPAPHDLDDDVDGRKGVAVLGAGHGRILPSTPLYAFSLPEPRGYRTVPFLRGLVTDRGRCPSRGRLAHGGTPWHERCYIEDVESPESGGE